MDRYSLQGIAGKFAGQLSGGQRQRVMVARALILKPRVILADEPVSMVDASLRATILESLRDWGRACYCASGADNTCGKRFGWQLGESVKNFDGWRKRKISQRWIYW